MSALQNEQPLVSIVLPVYNAADTIERAIQSVQSQTYPHWELLVVDDGSTDQSGALCDRCAQNDARIHVVHTPNAGVSHARNTALQAATGEWVAFLDSDDWYEPSFLQVMLSHAAEVDMVACTFRTMPDRHQTTTCQKNDTDTDAHAVLERSVCKGEMIIATTLVWNKLFRHSCIKTLFDERIHYSEDTLFVLQNWKNLQTVRIIPDCLYNYYCIPVCSLSKKLSLTSLKGFRNIRLAFTELLKDSPEAMKKVTGYEQEQICYYFLKLTAFEQKSKQDKLLVMNLQINEALVLPAAPYGVQCRSAVYRLLWRTLQTLNVNWIYFVFRIMGKFLMRPHSSTH